MLHITQLAKITLLGVLMASGTLYAQEVYSWKSKSGTNTYSDAPRNLKPTQANVINVRTQTVTPIAPVVAAASTATPDSLADEQADLNNRMAQQNKEIEERNKKIAEENRVQKEADCKRAQLNLSLAESARVPNREELLKRYNEDITHFCN